MDEVRALIPEWRKNRQIELDEAAREGSEPGNESWGFLRAADAWKGAIDDLEQALAQPVPAEGAGAREPWLYAIEVQSEDGRWSWSDGEQCVFADLASAQDEVDLLNDGVEDWQGSPYRVVPLYRAAAAQPDAPKDSPMQSLINALHDPRWQEESTALAREVADKARKEVDEYLRNPQSPAAQPDKEAGK
jgi:hypothetical protein